MYEQSLSVEPESGIVDDLNAAEGLDALEEEVEDDDADESEQETEFPAHESGAAKVVHTTTRKEKSRLKKRNAAIRKLERKAVSHSITSPKGSDGIASITDEAAPEEHDDEATRAPRKPKPLLIYSDAFTAGVNDKERERELAALSQTGRTQAVIGSTSEPILHLVATFVSCMYLYYMIESAYMCTVIYMEATHDKDVSTAEQSQTRKTWTQRVREAQSIIRHMFLVPKGFTVDSGAAAHVMPKGWIMWLIAMTSWGSRNGIHYVAANGGRIPNEGQSNVVFRSVEGIRGMFTFQLAKVNKPLLSVAMLVKDGKRVVFDEGGSYIYDKRTGDIMRLKQERGVFVLDAYVAHDPSKPMPANAKQPFSRPE